MKTTPPTGRSRRFRRRVSLLPALLALALGIGIAPPAHAQWGWGDRGGFNPADMLDRFDANGDGMLDPAEIPERARGFVERLAGQANISTGAPISLERIKSALANNSGDGSDRGRDDRSRDDRGRDDRGRDDRSRDDRSRSDRDRGRDSSRSAPPEPLVPGFGEPQDLPPVPGFGEGSALSLLDQNVEDRYEKEVIDYVNSMLQRYDRNGNEVLDAEEWSGVRWSNDPKESDLNGDGRLTKAELCERIAQRWGRGWKPQGAATAVSFRGGGSGTSSSGSSSSGSSSGGSSSSGSSSSGSSSSGSSSNVDDRTRGFAQDTLRRYDENKNGRLEKEEWSRMRGDPKAIDANGDDIITEEELVARFASFSSRWGGGGESRGSDSSSSRERGASPSSAAAGSSSRGSNSRGSTAVFGEGDVYRVKSPLERLPRGLPSWFEQYDTNADGQVSMWEFATSWDKGKVEEFQRYDLNGDGVITAAECLAANQAKSTTSVARTSEPRGDSRSGDSRSGDTRSGDSRSGDSRGGETPRPFGGLFRSSGGGDRGR